MIIEATGFDHSPLTGKQLVLHDAGVSSIHTTSKKNQCVQAHNRTAPPPHIHVPGVTAPAQWRLDQGNGRLPKELGFICHGQVAI